MGTRTRRVLIALAAAAVAVAVGVRIWWVNATFPAIPLEYYDEGEWVALEGCFHYDNSEPTQDYSVRVEGVSVMTYDEYMSAYGDRPEEIGRHGDQRSIVCVDLRIRNDGDEQGGFLLIAALLTPERGNEYLQLDMFSEISLWPYNTGISTEPHTERLVHVPYVVNALDDEAYANPIEDREFTLLVSQMPVRKMIHMTAEDSPSS